MSYATDTQSRTIQTWPGGEGFEYRGDIHGPDRQLRRHDWNRAEPTPWGPGAPEDWRKVQIEVLAEMYQERDIFCCDSSLVDDLLRNANENHGDLAEGFSYDEIRNMYPDPDEWDAEECRNYISEHNLEEPDRPTTGDTCPVCQGKESAVCVACVSTGEVLDPDADEDESRFGYLTELRNACREHCQENPAEVFEWWRVSSWLCDKLHEIGEVTIDNGYGHWWGRTCTGQAYIMDGTLQRVAAQFVKEGEE